MIERIKELLDIDMYPHYQERLKKRFGSTDSITHTAEIL